MGTVLALRALNLGDLLVAVPALRGLRRAFAGDRIVLATAPVLRPLVDLADVADELLPATGLDGLPGLTGSVDVAVNLHGRGPQSHQALDALTPGRRIGFRCAGWNGPDFDQVAARHPHERDRWCAMLAHHGIAADPDDLRLPATPRTRRPGGHVLVHPGARYGAKRWPAQRFAAVAGALDRGHRPVFLTGSAAERVLACGIADAAGLSRSRVLAGRTDLAELAALVAGAELVISGDTGIAHLAAAFATPSVTLFGPVGPEQWGPPATGPHVVLSDAAARRGDAFAPDPDPALLGVAVRDVMRAAISLRQGRTAP